MSYAVANLDDIEETTDGRCPWRPVRHHFGITSFGINAWTGREAGDRIINEHDEKDEQEELYLVQRGRARFELDGESLDAPAGTLVYAQPGVKRTAFAEEPATTIVVVGGEPGKAYEVSGYEIWMPFHALYEEGKYAEAADAARGPVEAAPEYAMPLYNLACCEALAGARTMRWNTCAPRLRALRRSGYGSWRARTPTSIRSATSRASPSWSADLCPARTFITLRRPSAVS
jgi:hypothetical protein